MLSVFLLIGHFSFAVIGARGELDFLFAVDQSGHTPTDQHSDHNVDDGVLFQEYGGNTDQERSDIEEAPPAGEHPADGACRTAER